MSGIKGVSVDELSADAVAFDSTGSPNITADNVQDAILENEGAADTALNTPRYAIPLLHNGTVGGGTFFGYSNLLPGNDTPIIIPLKSELFEFTYSNKNSNADYTLEFRKNSTTGTILYTISKTNTQFFTDAIINIPFDVGDEIYVKYIDNGGNSSDAVLVLFFKAVP